MSPWQAVVVAMVVLLDQVLDRVSAIAKWFREQLSWSQRKSVNLAVLISVVIGLAIYFWPTGATAQAKPPAPAVGEFEILGGACTPDGGIQVAIDVSKAGLIGIEIPAAVLRGCSRNSRI